VSDATGILARRIAEKAIQIGARLAVAESLTGGLICSELARAPKASSWFSGGVVAYCSHVKFELLGVPKGPVVSEQAALAMAGAVARITGASHAVAVTGVGGPERQDGQPVGTVWIAVRTEDRSTARRFEFDGGPSAICHAAVRQAMLALKSALV
jgi:PncC family amidohydrolase